MREAWIYLDNQAVLSQKKNLIAALACIGISIDSTLVNVPQTIGIVLLNEMHDESCELLRQLTHKGQRAVLAVAMNPDVFCWENMWQVLDAGVIDIVQWDKPDKVARLIADRLARWDTVNDLLESPVVKNNLAGESASWRSLLRRIVEVAHFTNNTVLIIGDTGTGKELIARLIHSLDARKKKSELVVLDCTTITAELAGSELFGHERGAFTGATGPREGAFALANGGTLFLDELGELPLMLQAKLLRAVQERTYKSVGGNRWHRTEFRLVSATNRELLDEVSAGAFRGDLYYRLASWVFRLPSLQQRKDDIVLLAKHFLGKFCTEGPVPPLDDAVKTYLLSRDYPGNVRQLEHLVLQMYQRHVGDGPISIGDIPEHERPTVDGKLIDWRDERFEQVIQRAVAMGADLKAISEYAKDTAIRLAVSDEQGNIQRAARKLGVTDRTVQLRRANSKLETLA